MYAAKDVFSKLFAAHRKAPLNTSEPPKPPKPSKPI